MSSVWFNLSRAFPEVSDSPYFLFAILFLLFAGTFCFGRMRCRKKSFTLLSAVEEEFERLLGIEDDVGWDLETSMVSNVQYVGPRNRLDIWEADSSSLDGLTDATGGTVNGTARGMVKGSSVVVLCYVIWQMVCCSPSPL